MRLITKASRHPDKALSAVKVRALAKPGKYADGGGLYLVVEPSGAKRWLLRTVIRGKRCDIGLGGARLVSLAEARDTALAMRKVARNGDDPLAARRKTRKVVPTFSDAAHTVHKAQAASWKNPKHRAQWINTLSEYAFPVFGELSVDVIDTPEVLKALSPIWLTKPETARRVRQRIGNVLDWAKAAGFRQGDNPADTVTRGLPKQPDRDQHHAALPYAEVPSFIESLHQSDISESAKLAFEFLILTATRTNEVLLCHWNEMDLSNQCWTIPKTRMKAGREHRVPLSSRCLEILKRAKLLSGDNEFVFPGASLGKPLSNMAFLMTLRRMNLTITAHGFRSAFRDWAAETTHFAREVCEMALAHTIKNKAEAAYRRGDLFDKRRALMNTWSAFVARGNAKIVSLRRRTE